MLCTYDASTPKGSSVSPNLYDSHSEKDPSPEAILSPGPEITLYRTSKLASALASELPPTQTL
jgi:hypothetical protein